MARERTDMASPLLGSILLHGSLALAVLVSWPWLGRHVTVAPAVPVTIVARGPVANVRPAEQAPVEAEAATEDPAPDAPPEVVPPPPPVKAAAAEPKPAPKPAP
ncbi:MAG TPA: energy transducer TonB, partial [Caulobacteraceae bacterium]